MRVEDIRTLYDYYYWATARILDAAAQVSDEQFVAPSPIGDRGLRSTLVHALSVERGWRSGWEGLGRPAALQDEDFPTPAALAARWREEEARMRAYLAALSDDDLEGKFYDFALWHTLVHVANHGTQHRSEAAMLLTAYGHSPGDLDFAFFVQDRPSEPMTKARFLDTLRAERANWEATLARVPEARMTEPGVVGDWSVKDLVAHVTWYEREMVGVARGRALAGSDLWGQADDPRNAAIFAQNRDRPLPDILAEARAVHRQLLDALEPLADEDFRDPRRFRQMPDTWIPWQVFAANSYNHYRDHLPALQAWLDANRSGSEPNIVLTGSEQRGGNL